MITTPTVFILGAGASVPYGLLSGAELVVWIRNVSRDELTPYGVGVAEFDEFAKQLSASAQSSVDAFLEHREEFLNVGKTAIAARLAGLENPAYVSRVEEDWYTWLLDRMTVATPFADLRRNQVSFVTFNYDRSLEHHLHTGLRARYGKSVAEVAEVLSAFPIVHVHGRLGYLPWEKAAENEKRDYSNTLTPEAVKTAAKGIKIMSENRDDSPEFQEAQRLMQNARRIGILGFGYHRVNMNRLKLPLDQHRQTFGTCYGTTGAECEFLKSQYPRLALGSNGHMIKAFLRNTYEFQLD
jgi:hypothetical protein